MLYCVMGPSGSGKDTVVNYIVKLSKQVYAKLVQFTTRPKREGEIDGVTYNFISMDDFLKYDKEDIAEYREYKVADGSTWVYGTFKSELLKSKDRLTITVCSPSQFRSYYNIISGYIIPVFIYAPKAVLLMRALKRNTEHNLDNMDIIQETIRRFLDDKDYNKDYHLDPNLKNLSIMNYDCPPQYTAGFIDTAISDYEFKKEFDLRNNKIYTEKELKDLSIFKALLEEG